MSALRKRDDFCTPWNAEAAYDFAALWYDSWNWQSVWRETEQAMILDSLAGFRSVDRVLDVGCGTGSLLNLMSAKLPKARLSGVDISEAMIKQAKRKNKGNKVHLEKTDFLNVFEYVESFDVILMCRVASHIRDIRPYFSKIRSFLRPDGVFIYSDVFWEHDYDFTRLPTRFGKIAVETHKHKVSEIVRAAYVCDLVPSDIKAISVNQLPVELAMSDDLPLSLKKRLGDHSLTPFGCVIEFKSLV